MNDSKLQEDIRAIRQRAIDAIYKSYGTKDLKEIYGAAAARRAGTPHAEQIRNGESVCLRCDMSNELFHPEAFLEDLS